jgi:hypothetical protein
VRERSPYQIEDEDDEEYEDDVCSATPLLAPLFRPPDAIPASDPTPSAKLFLGDAKRR